VETISFGPSDGLSYNPNESLYWDKEALQKEIIRTFELCHSCRMCFKFCDAFPELFNMIDKEDLNVVDINEDHINRVAEKCFQCKICYFKCPYTKADKHDYNLDFPRLLMRYQAIGAKEKGVKFVDKMLGNPDFIGKLGCGTAPLANWANKNPVGRFMMEKTIGIHKEKALPPFASETFLKWYEKNKSNYHLENDEIQDKVIIFYTCFGNYNNPDIAKDLAFVLFKNKIHFKAPKLNCCGMPAMESGNLDFATKEAAQNFDTLYPYIQQGYKVLVLNPTCSLTMKDDYPILLEKQHPKENLDKFSDAIFDTNEYLFTLKRENKINRNFKSTPGKVAYHIACHLRAQNIGYRSRDMMKTIGNTSFTLVDECCGHNGTWAMKKDNFKDSLKIGSKAFDRIKAAEHDIIASDCPLAAIQLEQGLGEPVLHTIQVLAKAYRQDGFETKLEEQQDV
jgi:glycerol-3-phosphate dehydrogenase subunit C